MAQGAKFARVAERFILRDHIYDVIRDAILDMNIYDENTDLRLDERKMAEQLGISRTPIREALARLDQGGFVEIQPRKGVYIRRKSLDEILEMIIVWAALESMAARLATERASDEELAALRRSATQYSPDAARADIAEYSAANVEFHQRIFALAKCNGLKSIADGLFLHMHSVRRRAMGESDRASRSVVDHMGIVEALEERNADVSAKRVLEHTMRLHDHVRRVWRTLEERRRAAGLAAAVAKN